MLTFIGLGFLGFNFMVTSWRLDPIYDLLVLRTQGLIFAGNHVSTAMAVLLTAAWFAARDASRAFQVTTIVFASVSVHEAILVFATLPSGANFGQWQGWAWMGAVFLLALKFAGRKQRLTLLAFGCIYLIFAFAATAFLVATRTPALSFVDGKLGPAYYLPLSQLIEVLGWFIPMSAWWYRGF